MAEVTETTDNDIPFDQHPLYHQALQHLSNDNTEQALAKLRRLSGLYPEEQAIRDLLVRTELRASMPAPQRLPKVRGRPRPFLRTVVLGLLVLTGVLVGMAGLVWAYEEFVAIDEVAQQETLQLTLLRQDCEQRTSAGAWSLARDTCERLLQQVPNDPVAAAALETIAAGEALDQLIVDAVSADQRGDRQLALDLYRQVLAQQPGNQEAARRIAALVKEQELEATWQTALNFYQAGDWLGLISILAAFRSENPDYQRLEAEEMLYQAYMQLAGQQEAQANGDPDILRRYVEYVDEALALRPTGQDLRSKRSLAYRYVLGFDAATRGDWVEAVDAWEAAYAIFNNYQNGMLEENLQQAYAKAAYQLLDEAKGDADTLRDAIGFLDQALTYDPDNEQLMEERRLAIEFVTGAGAFAQGEWEIAIARWGPIYALRQDYQQGEIEVVLKEACSKSFEPDEELCPPQ